MTTEAVSKDCKVGYAHSKVAMKKKSGYRSRCRRRNHDRYAPDNKTVPMTLQRLFLSCKDVFTGPGTVPAPSHVQMLCSILDDMKPEDVGLSSELQLLCAKGAMKGTPIVTSTTIYKCQNFSLCLFFLPPTAVIPLHNHPGMTVFNKLLLGTVHIKSYDWVDPVDTNDSAVPTKPRLAKLVADSDYTAPCNSSVLYPTTGGNMHEFTAITTCAVLDVLGPPYSKDDGRDCSYYKELPLPAVPNGENQEAKEDDGGGSCRWLEEIGVPENSHMDEIDYLGPQIIE